MAIPLSNQQLDTVMIACQPLAPEAQSEFLHALANILAGESQPVGDGQLWRAIREVQRLYWTPPPVTQLRSTGNMHTRRRVGAAIP